MTISESAANELRQRLEALRSEAETLEAELESLTERARTNRREREAISLLLGEPGEPEADESPEGEDGRRRGWRGRRGRPSIRELAFERAEANRGVVRLRDLLREAHEHGFKSDHGGLHTYLKGLHDDFEQSGPGEFRIRMEVKAPRGRHATED